ncbi:biotin-dependent carboxyltransferase family protein [Desulfococcaceae bacterium HSG9]|nr:biotin-dependent carboxyltransferase family protein [Desulfococcaceae bacterium HSG9]
MDTFLILTPGPYTTIQDKGRFGYQHIGVPLSGALDQFALRIANLLTGNPEDSAVLEITVLGPQLAVLQEADIALTGAEMQLKINDKPAASWQTIRVEPGDRISIQQIKTGCRGYLSVSGGFDTPVIMGSRSTYTGGKLGGQHGRPLKKGDILGKGAGPLLKKPRQLAKSQIPRYTEEITLRALPGPQDDFFDEGLDFLFKSEYTVTGKADRMGYRLQGAPIKTKENQPASIISEPTMPGGIQIPADQQPIILLVEQTVGGYTKIATVISSDLALVAQATPGVKVRFEQVSLETAHRLYNEDINRMQTIAEQLSGP